MLQILKQCTLFEEIRQEELPGLLKCLGAQKRRYAKGSMILAEGEAAGEIGILLQGAAQVIREDYTGSRSMLAGLQPGEMFAEAFACAGIARMPVSVLAVEESEVLLIDAGRLIHTCGQACAFHQQLIMNLVKILAMKNLMSNQKIEMISRRTTRDKLLAYLNLQARKAGSVSFSIPFNRQELADYLEVDRSGLSAEISKLRREGVLKCDKNRFTLILEESR